ncbi:MAG TPA: hypothetical protein VHN12_04230 [Geobacteraceae bacterium]|nr:hypothetical protein [Geobacteraceae bacterium]
MTTKYAITISGLFVTLALCSCATTPIPSERAILISNDQVIDSRYMKQAPDTGEVIIKRDDGFGGSACSSKVFVDSIPIAVLWRAEKVVLYLPEGDHIFGAWPNGVCGGGLSETRGTVQIGKRITFRIGYGSNGDYYIVPTAF